MQEELDALKLNKTWEIIELCRDKKPIGCRWTYKIKYNSNSKIVHYKARSVVKGYTQTPKIDFQETFASITKMTSIRVILSMAAQNK